MGEINEHEWLMKFNATVNKTCPQHSHNAIWNSNSHKTQSIYDMLQLTEHARELWDTHLRSSSSPALSSSKTVMQGRVTNNALGIISISSVDSRRSTFMIP